MTIRQFVEKEMRVQIAGVDVPSNVIEIPSFVKEGVIVSLSLMEAGKKEDNTDSLTYRIAKGLFPSYKKSQFEVSLHYKGTNLCGFTVYPSMDIPYSEKKEVLEKVYTHIRSFLQLDATLSGASLFVTFCQGGATLEDLKKDILPIILDGAIYDI